MLECFLCSNKKSHNDKAKNDPSSIRALFEPCGECAQVNVWSHSPLQSSVILRVVKIIAA